MTRTLAAGLALLAVIAGMVACAPLLAAHNPGQQDLLHVLAGPSAAHPLGTDDLDRDLWARLLYAGRA
ncbi:MAG: ABC transporter permease, partial [Streptosporangiaceae bacterium]|nr:ABC transporter permease [Streptosporangiaceae bacterium]